VSPHKQITRLLRNRNQAQPRHQPTRPSPPGAYGGIVIFDSDVIGSTGYTCSFDYELQEWLAFAEIIGSALVWPIIDNRRIGIWGGRFGAQFWPMMVAGLSLMYYKWDENPNMRFAMAMVSRGLISSAVSVCGIAITEWYVSSRGSPGSHRTTCEWPLSAARPTIFCHASSTLVLAPLIRAPPRSTPLRYPTRYRATGTALSAVFCVGSYLPIYWAYFPYSAGIIAEGLGVVCCE